MKWRPIKTAPKTGKWILMYQPSKGKGKVDMARWQWDVFHEKKEWGGAGWSYYIQPTHWMPLPSQPSKGLDTSNG